MASKETRSGDACHNVCPTADQPSVCTTEVAAVDIISTSHERSINSPEAPTPAERQAAFYSHHRLREIGEGMGEVWDDARSLLYWACLAEPDPSGMIRRELTWQSTFRAAQLLAMFLPDARVEWDDGLPWLTFKNPYYHIEGRFEAVMWRVNADRWRDAPYQEYLASEQWAKRRGQALARAGNRCQVCNATDGLQVHHRTYERRGDEDPEDLTVLCAECHKLFHDNRELQK